MSRASKGEPLGEGCAPVAHAGDGRERVRLELRDVRRGRAQTFQRAMPSLEFRSGLRVAANGVKPPLLECYHQAARRRSINPQTNNMSTAPTIAPIKPAFSPDPYQPMACPR